MVFSPPLLVSCVRVIIRLYPPGTSSRLWDVASHMEPLVASPPPQTSFRCPPPIQPISSFPLRLFFSLLLFPGGWPSWRGWGELALSICFSILVLSPHDLPGEFCQLYSYLIFLVLWYAQITPPLLPTMRCEAHNWWLNPTLQTHFLNLVLEIVSLFPSSPLQQKVSFSYFNEPWLFFLILPRVFPSWWWWH